MSTLRGRNVLLGITGGIAAYKMPAFIRTLKGAGADVRVLTTRNAGKFVTRTVLETVSGNRTYEHLFPKTRVADTAHVELGKWAHCMLVAPASANCIGKLAAGIADDLLTTVATARRCPLVLAPAMNTAMYANARVQANIARLRDDGVLFCGPASGSLACGDDGPGRLADETALVDAVDSALASAGGDLAGRRVLVSAGRTEEPLDPVRIFTNRSSGKMGFAVAAAARDRGAAVTVVAGRTDTEPPSGVTVVRAETVDAMREALRERLADADVLVMSAAVSDYRPVAPAPGKMKKGAPRVTVEMEATPDILAGLAEVKDDRVFVGFALETENETAAAAGKLERKNLDLIAVNNPLRDGAGFRGDTNRLTLVGRDGTADELPLLSKREAADRLLDRVVRLLS